MFHQIYHNALSKVLAMLTLLFLLGIQGLTIAPTAAQTNTVAMTPTPITDYLANPGIGWQHMVGNTPYLLPETVAYPTRQDISWRNLQPGRNEYRWALLDTMIDDAYRAGKLFSFRVYTMQGEEYGGHHVPQWVLEQDSTIIQGDDPNYSNCVYQENWARFVDQLRQRYDGDARIAFIDISGYGNFNEWSWIDDQTEWDDDALNPTTIDGLARRRLADMYIGGSNSQHRCVNSNGQLVDAAYHYDGFAHTQLVMPYAGIQQSTRYVASRRSDVGIRYDCLGRDARLEKIEDVIEATWRNAPIVFEFCAGSGTDEGHLSRAETLLNRSHGTSVHDNLDWPRQTAPIETLMTNVGYRYQLDQAVFNATAQIGEGYTVSMAWRNVGKAPAYPRMGHHFALHLYLLDQAGNVVYDHASDARVDWWMPADDPTTQAPENIIGAEFVLPDHLQAGQYTVSVAIVHTLFNTPINLAIDGRDENGRYDVGTVELINEATPPTTPEPTTVVPTTPVPTTVVPTTPAPTTPVPTTVVPTTPAPTTVVPTTPVPTTVVPTTVVPPPVIPTTPVVLNQYKMHVGDLHGRIDWESGTYWGATVRVTVKSINDRNVQGALVTGVWHDGTVRTCTTNRRGRCWLSSADQTGDTVSLTIQSLAHPNFVYAPEDNTDPDIDKRNPMRASDGTTITFSRSAASIPGEPTTPLPPMQPVPTDPTMPPPSPVPSETVAPPVQPLPVTNPGQSVHIADLNGAVTEHDMGWVPMVDVTVHNQNDQAVAGVVVTASWQDGAVTTCTTDGNGHCRMITAQVTWQVNSATMTITNLAASNYSYNPSANHDIDTGTWQYRHDSDGTTITFSY